MTEHFHILISVVQLLGGGFMESVDHKELSASLWTLSKKEGIMFNKVLTFITSGYNFGLTGCGRPAKLKLRGCCLAQAAQLSAEK